VSLKLLLKRGALVAAANWPIVAIQFVAETTFQVLLAVPVIGAAVLVAALLGGDLAELLRGNLRDIFSTIAATLTAEPVALIAFIAAFTIVLLGGSLLMFIVKGGTVEVLLAAESLAGPIESEPLAYHTVTQEASHFTLDRFLAGSRRLSRRYIWLGLVLIIVYGLSGGAYLTFVAYGYQAAGGRLLVISWIFNTALATVALVLWLTFVNWWYLLLQIVMASEDLGLVAAAAEAGRFVRAEFRELAGMFGVILIVIVAATLASALAWSGVGLIAFVPLVGLAVFPLQIAALVVRGLVFEYIGLGALAAYATLYHRYLAECGRVARPSTARLKPLDGHI
jgi:hypothetical protein